MKEPQWSSAAAPSLAAPPQRAVTRRPPQPRAVAATGAEETGGLQLPACRAPARHGQTHPGAALHTGSCSFAGRREGVRAGSLCHANRGGRGEGRGHGCRCVTVGRKRPCRRCRAYTASPSRSGAERGEAGLRAASGGVYRRANACPHTALSRPVPLCPRASLRQRARPAEAGVRV